MSPEFRAALRPSPPTLPRRRLLVRARLGVRAHLIVLARLGVLARPGARRGPPAGVALALAPRRWLALQPARSLASRAARRGRVHRTSPTAAPAWPPLIRWPPRRH